MRLIENSRPSVLNRLTCEGLNIAGLPDYTGQGAVGADIGYIPGYSPVVPDISFLDLPGQFISIPGGAVSNGANASADSSGINQIYVDPAVNPTPTGGYMSALLAVAQAGMQAFTTYAKGSPSVATPQAKMPSGKTFGAGILTNPQGGTNWFVVGGVVFLGMVGLVVLAKYA